jgi:hypothetical protein
VVNLGTGADRFGARYPIVERNYGENDYRPAMYSWLDALSIKLSGFSVTAGRLPAAILGILSLILIYSFAMTAGGGSFALLTLLLAVLSPLHIQYSRIAHEGAMPARVFRDPDSVALAAGSGPQIPGHRQRCARPCSWTVGKRYQATKLTAFLFAVVIGVHILMRGRIKAAALIAFAIGAFLGALPQLIVMLSQTHQFFARAKILSVQADNPVSYAACGSVEFLAESRASVPVHSTRLL